MRIAYLFQQYPVPTQTFAQSDIAALRAAGHRVDIYTMKPGSGGSDEAHRVNRPSIRGALYWPRALWRSRRALPKLLLLIGKSLLKTPKTAATAFFSLPRAAEIADAICTDEYDVVHLFWARHTALVPGILKGRSAPVLRSAFAGAYDLEADDFLVELAMISSQIGVSHAQTNAPFLRERLSRDADMAIVARGIPLMEFDPSRERDPNLWVTASALVKEKNVEAVIQAFNEALRDIPDLRLKICGDGPDRKRLEQICERLDCANRVEFTGHISRRDFFDQLQNADCFWLLSKKASERLPNVIKEALWAGCTVVSSASQGIEELLPSREMGIIVDPDDPATVNQAAREILARGRSNEAARIRAARRFIKANFCAETSMARYVEHWEAAHKKLGHASASRSSPESVS